MTEMWVDRLTKNSVCGPAAEPYKLAEPCKLAEFYDARGRVVIHCIQECSLPLIQECSLLRHGLDQESNVPQLSSFWKKISFSRTALDPSLSGCQPKTTTGLTPERNTFIGVALFLGGFTASCLAFIANTFWSGFLSSLTISVTSLGIWMTCCRQHGSGPRS